MASDVGMAINGIVPIDRCVPVCAIDIGAMMAINNCVSPSHTKHDSI